MKTVTKITAWSCVFCYFAGFWIIASRFGLLKLVTKYGIAEAFDQIPKDFPQIKYLYIGLAVYTVLFILLSYIIIRYSEQAAKDQEQLQLKTAEIVSYAELMKTLCAQYERSDIKNTGVAQKLQTLSRQIASLPPAVVRNVNMQAEISNVIKNLQTLLSDKCTAESFSAAIDNARDAVDSIKRRSITIKQ